MISEWFYALATLVSTRVAGLFPAWELPEQIVSPQGMLAQIMALGYGLEPWVDWAFVMVCGAIPLAVWVFGLAVRAGRVVIGHLPQIGGNG